MKKILLIIAIVIGAISNAQSNITAHLTQDVRLAAFGDNNGNKPFTTNILSRIDLEGNQRQTGYWTVGAGFEYAATQRQYYRYSLHAGYTFNQFKLFGSENFSVTYLLNYGGIVREDFQYDKETGAVYTSFGGSTTFSYAINDRFRITAIGQVTHRVDKNTLYGSDASYTLPSIKADLAGFLGLSYTFKLPSIRK